MGLEITTSKTPGEELRRTVAPRPPVVGLAIIALTVLQWVFMVLIIMAIANGWNSPVFVTPEVEAAPFSGIIKSDQQIVSLWMAGAFYCLAFVTLLYQRYFMDHVTIAKKRFRKFEDEGVQLK